VRGYWGDIVCSPYFAFGVDCDTPNPHAEGLFEIYNKNTGTEQHRHHAVEVALYSLFSHLWELEHHSKYVMTKANDIFSGLGEEKSQAKQTVKHNVNEVEEGGKGATAGLEAVEEAVIIGAADDDKKAASQERAVEETCHSINETASNDIGKAYRPSIVD
jgi:hypothetical protein